jgi:hypothetical protein
MPIQFDLKKYKSSHFIETGTFKGGGCINAIQSGFTSIHSIEILEKNLNIAKANISKFIGDRKDLSINLHLGDSAKLLSEILSDINTQATFWLDGHGGYGEAGAGEKNCPLYEELDIIKKHHIKNHIIMIDDLRIIRGTHGGDRSWGTTSVTEEGVTDKLKSINPSYELIYEDGVIENDCLIAVAYS